MKQTKPVPLTPEQSGLVAANVRLVWREANRYARPAIGAGVDDLYGEGVIGLIDAVRGFDPAKGFKFSTYAVPCIQRRIWRYLSAYEGRMVPQEPESGRGDGFDMDAPAMDAVPGREREAGHDDGPPDVLPLLAGLDKLRREVVAAAYGVGGVRLVTIATLARRFHSKPKVIRAILKDALVKLRADHQQRQAA